MSPVISSGSNNNLELFFKHLRHQPAVLVQVSAVEGSVPREVGAWMAVFTDSLVGTVGGGHLEFEAIDQARLLLESGGEKKSTLCTGTILGPVLRRGGAFKA